MIKAEYREENLEQLADFFEFAPVGMVLLDANGRVLRANVAALEVLRYFDARSEAAGLPFGKLFVDPEVGRKALDTASAGGTVLHLKTKLRARDGEEVEVLLDGNARTDGGALNITRDQGDSWTIQTPWSNAASNAVLDVAYGGGTFIAYAWAETTSGRACFVSSDAGDNWTACDAMVLIG